MGSLKSKKHSCMMEPGILALFSKIKVSMSLRIKLIHFEVIYSQTNTHLKQVEGGQESVFPTLSIQPLPLNCKIDKIDKMHSCYASKGNGYFHTSFFYTTHFS